MNLQDLPWIEWTLALLAGGVLGVFFFGGLWWTLRRALASRRPALWVMSSFLLRVGVAGGGFVFVSAGHWQRVLACLLGFLIARHLVNRFSAHRTISQHPA